jgi:hypothetical protein
MHTQNDIIRRPAVLAMREQSEASLSRDIAAGFCTRALKLSPDPKRRAVGWPRREIERLNAAIISGATAEQLRALVTVLHEQRAAGAPKPARRCSPAAQAA